MQMMRLLQLAVLTALGNYPDSALALRPLRLGLANRLQVPGARGVHGVQPLRQVDDFGRVDGWGDAQNNAAQASNTSIVYNGTFEQYIDHTNQKMGTFVQHYIYDTTWYKGEGAPIVFMTGGLAPLDDTRDYVSLRFGLQSTIAEQLGAALVVLENRYQGNSSPFPQLTTRNMQYLTPHQIAADLVHFSATVKFPFDPKGLSTRPHAPWIYSDGADSGIVGAWAERYAPGTWYATHVSGAPSQSIYDYQQYFTPIQKNMPQNCSHDFAAIFAHVDDVLQHGTAQQISELKAMFGLAKVEHNDDFAAAISEPIGLWEQLQFYNGHFFFFEMCDAIEANKTSQGSAGLGLPPALINYAKYFKDLVLPGSCSQYGYPEWSDPNNVDCFNTYNASSPKFTDTAADGPIGRGFIWATCNWPLFGYGFSGAPPCTQSDRISSCLVSAAYNYRQCSLYFPADGTTTFNSGGESPVAAAARLNKDTGGWDFTGTNRFIWVTHGLDQYKDLTVGSDIRPGGPYQGTKQNPLYYIKGGYHCSDLAVDNGPNNAEVAAVQKQIIAQIVAWVKELKQ